MHRFRLRPGLALLLATVVLGMVLVAWEVEAGVPLSGGRQLRVLKVTLGTNHVFSAEPPWKQFMRRVLPQAWLKSLGPPRIERVTTRFDSLVLWLDQVHPQRGQLAPPPADDIEVRMPDGSFVPGKAIMRPAGLRTIIEFDRFDRAARQVLLRFRDGTNLVLFQVTNPRPARPAQWKSQSLPQTTTVAQATIVLHRMTTYVGGAKTHGGFDISLAAQATGPAPMGWTYWQATVFDPLGNWLQSGEFPSGRTRLTLSSLPTNQATWRLLAAAQEYLTAGFVSETGYGTCVVCDLSPRLRELGVRLVMFTGGGAFQIADGRVTPMPDPKIFASTGSLAFSPVQPQRSAGAIDLITPAPGVILLTGLPSVPLRARLRSRNRGPGERIYDYSPRPPVTLTNTANSFQATFFTPHHFAGSTNLEIEIVARHPPAEFFVNLFEH